MLFSLQNEVLTVYMSLIISNDCPCIKFLFIGKKQNILCYADWNPFELKTHSLKTCVHFHFHDCIVYFVTKYM
jgi:hypothetical protein